MKKYKYGLKMPPLLNKQACMLILTCTHDYIREFEVKIENIETNMYGEDLVTFTCPECGCSHKSRRYETILER